MNSKNWPKWFRIHYLSPGRDKGYNHMFSAANEKILFEILDRLGIQADDVLAMYTGENFDELVTTEKVEQTFRWVLKMRREMDEYEKRKEADESAKENLEQ